MESARNKRKWFGIVLGLGLIMTIVLSGCLNAAKESGEMGRLEKTDLPPIDTMTSQRTVTATFALG